MSILSDRTARSGQMESIDVNFRGSFDQKNPSKFNQFIRNIDQNSSYSTIKRWIPRCHLPMNTDLRWYCSSLVVEVSSRVSSIVLWSVEWGAFFLSSRFCLCLFIFLLSRFSVSLRQSCCWGRSSRRDIDDMVDFSIETSCSYSSVRFVSIDGCLVTMSK